MADALLVADQHVNENLLGRSGSNKAEQHTNEFREQTLRGFDSAIAHPLGKYVPFLQPGSRGEAFSLEAHLAHAEESLRRLAEAEQRLALERQFSQENAWLAANKQRYRGWWIAIEGDQLLAVGATSREVFSQLGTRTRPALVVRIEEEERPFAGW